MLLLSLEITRVFRPADLETHSLDLTRDSRVLIATLTRDSRVIRDVHARVES